MRHLEFTEVARADLKSIRRYSQRTWGVDRTGQYMAALRDTMKGLVAGTIVVRNRDDLEPRLQMAGQRAPLRILGSGPVPRCCCSCPPRRMDFHVTFKLTKPPTTLSEAAFAACHPRPSLSDMATSVPPKPHSTRGTVLILKSR